MAYDEFVEQLFKMKTQDANFAMVFLRTQYILFLGSDVLWCVIQCVSLSRSTRSEATALGRACPQAGGGVGAEVPRAGISQVDPASVAALAAII